MNIWPPARRIYPRPACPSAASTPTASSPALDRVQPGDTVTVTNLWETLTYTVREIRVIEPNDIADILIQPGRELLTLLTCHPYASGGRYRLVLYCERDEAAQ